MAAPTSKQSIHFACPRCGKNYVQAARVDTDLSATKLACSDCGFPIQFRGRCPSPDARIEQCVHCGNREFYTQKDFNRTLGVWLVVASGLVALLVMVLVDHRIGLAVLLAVTIADWLVFRFVRDVTVCYLCHTIYRGYPKDPSHEAFYLGNEERFKKLRQEWLQGLAHDD